MSGCRSALCADLLKHFHETLPSLLPVLLSICLTQAAWVGVYDCSVVRSIFVNESSSNTKGFLQERDIFTYPTSHAAKAVMALVSGLVTALVFWNFKIIFKSLQTLSWVACSFFISGVIIMDAASTLPVDESIQLAIGGAATAVYGGCTVLAVLTKLMPARCHQLFVITNCSTVAIFYLTCLTGSAAWCMLATVALGETFVVLGPFGALVGAFLQNYGSDRLHLTIHSTAVAPGGAHVVAGDDDDDDDEAVTFARPAWRLAAGRDHQLPRERGKNFLPIRRLLHDIGGSSSDEEEEGDESDCEVDLEEAKGCAELGFGLLVYSSVLVGSSMTVGVLPALATAVGALGGVAYVMSAPSDKFLPATAISIGGGVTGHGLGLTAMVALNYMLAAI